MRKTPLNRVTKRIAQRVLRNVNAGLCAGLGNGTPGHMCVEAAVCAAYGLPNSDAPPCVGAAVRGFKIALNDSPLWPSNQARAAGMRAVAIAQLGSVDLDQQEFAKRLAEGTIRRVLPIALRAAGLEAEAQRCEREGSEDAAWGANAANAENGRAHV